MLSYIDPLTSLFISALIVGERMNLQQLLGAVLLLGSTWISEGREKKRQPYKNQISALRVNL
ncbi:DMT family transporter [Paenibacillus tyrfis]|uniref:DMT family transporter n=1 Tax=Paenibacillus tyrfis TaxID=1501230 RepID=UPI000B58951A|nr:DMT family transporter [Paenibacillus tyrfis]